MVEWTPNGVSSHSKLDALNAALTEALGSGVTTRDILTMLSTAVAEQETEQRPLPGFPGDGQDLVYDEVPAGMIDLSAAAEKYGIPQSTMRQWVRKGKVPSRGRLRSKAPGGGTHIVHEGELLAYRAKHNRRGPLPKTLGSITLQCPKCGEQSVIT